MLPLALLRRRRLDASDGRSRRSVPWVHLVRPGFARCRCRHIPSQLRCCRDSDFRGSSRSTEQHCGRLGRASEAGRGRRASDFELTRYCRDHLRCQRRTASELLGKKTHCYYAPARSLLYSILYTYMCISRGRPGQSERIFFNGRWPPFIRRSTCFCQCVVTSVRFTSLLRNCALLVCT